MSDQSNEWVAQLEEGPNSRRVDLLTWELPPHNFRTTGVRDQFTNQELCTFAQAGVECHAIEKSEAHVGWLLQFYSEEGSFGRKFDWIARWPDSAYKAQAREAVGKVLATQQACTHPGEAIFWDPNDAPNEDHWKCLACGAVLGFRPDFDHRWLESKVHTILTAFCESGLYYVSNSDMGMEIIHTVAEWCREDARFDQTSILECILRYDRIKHTDENDETYAQREGREWIEQRRLARRRRTRCADCGGSGEVDTYPPHSADAYNSAGDPISYLASCNNCLGKGFIRG